MNDTDDVLYSELGGTRTTIVKGEGVYVYDDKGNRYLDAVGGVGVVNVGHGVKDIVTAIANQAQTLAFTYGASFENTPKRALASKLNAWAPEGMRRTKTLFSSGGTEATEAALKLAYQYHWERGKQSKRKIIGRWQSYHGNTLGALAVGGRTDWRRMHASLLVDFPHIAPPYCYRCPWGVSHPDCGIRCAEELRRVIRLEGAENIAAFIAEPVIGTSMSALVPPSEYYGVIREICDEFDILFIADEVMSGVGRTGLKWGIDHWRVTPDIITTAKGITGGYAALSATIVSERVWQAILDGSRKPMHSSTYGGNPLSCTAGLAVMTYIEKHRLIARAASIGETLLTKLDATLSDLPWVGNIRGKGLFIGVEIVANKKTKAPFPVESDMTHRIQENAFKRGLLILPGMSGLIDGVAGDHFQLLPPYTIEDDHVDFIVHTVRGSIEAAVKRQ